jgi:hypothetical protein
MAKTVDRQASVLVCLAERTKKPVDGCGVQGGFSLFEP